MSAPERRPWEISTSSWSSRRRVLRCDVCGENATKETPIVEAPRQSIMICGNCLEDARLTLEAHRETNP